MVTSEKVDKNFGAFAQHIETSGKVVERCGISVANADLGKAGVSF